MSLNLTTYYSGCKVVLKINLMIKKKTIFEFMLFKQYQKFRPSNTANHTIKNFMV